MPAVLLTLYPKISDLMSAGSGFFPPPLHTTCEVPLWSPWGQTLSWCCCHRTYWDAASMHSFHFRSLIWNTHQSRQNSLVYVKTQINHLSDACFLFLTCYFFLVVFHLEYLNIWSPIWFSWYLQASKAFKSSRVSPEWTGWAGGEEDCWCAPLCCGLPPPPYSNCVTVIPPFVGISPNLWSRTGGGRTGTRWRGEFSTPRPYCWHWDNFTYTPAYTRSYKVQAKGFGSEG